MSREIRNIVFDLGGVLFNFDFEEANASFARLGLSFGPENPHRRVVIMLLNGYINGFIAEEEFARRIKPYCTTGISFEGIMEQLQEFSGDLPKCRLDVLARLRSSYKVYLLSNINEKMWQWTVALMKEHGYVPADLFDATFLSYEMQMAKPNADIYRLMIEKTGMVPGETLYFDDLPENIEAGSRMGLCSHLVKQNCIEECEAYRFINNVCKQ